MKSVRFSNLLRVEKKSTIPAKEGKESGEYPFFTSSQKLSNFIDTHQYDGECLIIGTGGNPSIHYYKGKFAVSSHCSVFTLREIEMASLKYIFYYLSNNMELFEKGFKGAGLKNISNAFINNINIRIPSLNEQNRLVNVFDRVIKILDARIKSISAVSNFIIYDLFADYFGDTYLNEMKWPTIELEKLCKRIVDCPHSTPIYSDVITDFPCIRSSDIQNGFIDFSTTKYINKGEYDKRNIRYQPQGGEIIYCREGARFGVAAMLPHNVKSCLGQRTMLFIPNEERTNNYFLLALLNSNGLYYKAKQKSGGAGSPHVNIGDIKKFTVIYPPKELQDKFALAVEKAYITRSKMILHYKIFQSFHESLANSAFKTETLKTELSAFDFDKQVINNITGKEELVSKLNNKEILHQKIRENIEIEFSNTLFTFKDIERLCKNLNIEIEYDSTNDFETKGLKDLIFDFIDSNLIEEQNYLNQVFVLDEKRDAASKKDNSQVMFKINK